MTNRPLDPVEIEALKKIASAIKSGSRCDWLGGFLFWTDVKRNVDAMLRAGTNDGEDIVEELTDEYAKGRPWVMCRDIDSEEWRGPFKLIAVKRHESKFAVTKALETGSEVVNAFVFARPLTQEEKARYSK